MKKEKFHRFISAKMPRWFNCLYAHLFSYFWSSCPMCGRKFGGHEWFSGNSLYTSYGSGVGVCPRCGKRAEEINKKNNYFIPKFREVLYSKTNQNS